MNKKINEICVEYANKYGGGLPLTPQEMCNATVLWVEEQLNNFTPPEDEGVTVAKLMELIKGSDTIVVDENEAGTALEIHLDYEVVSKLDRAILTPLSTPQETSIPIVRNDGSVGYLPASSLQGTQTYLHKVVFQLGGIDGPPTEIRVRVYTTSPQPFTDGTFNRYLGNEAPLPCEIYDFSNETISAGFVMYDGGGFTISYLAWGMYDGAQIKASNVAATLFTDTVVII